MPLRDEIVGLVARKFTRRRLIQASSVSVAYAVVVGLKPTAASAAPAPTGDVPQPVSSFDPANLVEVDAHANTGLVRRSATLADTGVGLRILPNNRAKFLASTNFDLRVEATGVDPATAKIEVSVSGPGAGGMLSGEPKRTSSTDGSLEVTWRGLRYMEPGDFTVSATVTSGDESVSKEAAHEVVLSSADGAKARNVVFFLGDGMGEAAITAARLLSRGMEEGKYNGWLELDTLPVHGRIATSGFDAIATDSANSMSSYMTGHKTAVNAMGVYPANDPNPANHPWVETIAEMVKRARGMAVGIVTTAEVQDATPAAVFAHTRRRAEYVSIMEQALEPAQMPEVFMGGGLATFVPQSVTGSKRKDDRNLVDEFSALGFSYASTRGELDGIMAAGAPDRLLGIFHSGNMNVYLDRQHQPDPAILKDFTDQPTLWEMTDAAIKVLEKNGNGFFLMVEGASIDKQEHPLDWQRAAYDTIEFDKTIGMVKEWAAGRDDTLIVVTADHNHAMSITGTHDRTKGAGRAGVGVYADAGFPSFVDSDGDGFPDNPDPDRTLAIGWSNHPDFFEDYRLDPKPLSPAMVDANAPAAPVVPNPAKDAGAELQGGNLPFGEPTSVHTVEDVPVAAGGPGAERFGRVMDNTEVFFGLVDALGLDARGLDARG